MQNISNRRKTDERTNKQTKKKRLKRVEQNRGTQTKEKRKKTKNDYQMYNMK